MSSLFRPDNYARIPAMPGLISPALKRRSWPEPLLPGTATLDEAVRELLVGSQ